jgi:ABC-type multidrug transport system fused ATPase/permease subunit
VKIDQLFPDIRFLLGTLNQKKKTRLAFILFTQVVLSILDLVGVICFGLITALTINGVQSNPAQGRTSQILSYVGLLEKSLQFQVSALAISALIILVFKTVLSIKLTKYSLLFLSRESVQVAAHLLGRLLREQVTKIYSVSLQENLYSLTHGVNSLYVNVLGASMSQIADIALLLVLLTSLVILDPLLAIVSGTIFGMVGFALNYTMKSKVRRLGEEDTRISIAANELIVQSIGSVREIRVRNKMDYYVTQILETRMKLAGVITELAFIPSISKYVVELTTLVAAVLIGGLSFILQDSRQAITTLAVFIASGLRIAPAVLRIQQNSTVIKANLGSGAGALALLKTDLKSTVDEKISPSSLVFVPKVEFTNAFFTYPGANSPAISNLNLTIDPNSVTAITGPSGGGKSTLVDLLLGVLELQSGQVEISGTKPNVTTQLWPGKIGFVPQDVYTINGTIRQNIIMGFNANLQNDADVWMCLEKANLSDFVRSLPNSLDSEVGENGTMLSGGQRQRLGIARSLYTKPELLILDEATSSLDSINEYEVSKALAELSNSITVIVVAHRLATVRQATKLIYIENGRKLAEGTFDQVRSEIPNFNLQAEILGL